MRPRASPRASSVTTGRSRRERSRDGRDARHESAIGMSSPLGPTGFAALVCTGVFGACLGTSGAAGEDGGRVDVAILTFSRTALRAVVERLDESNPLANQSAPPETGEWTRGRVRPPRRGTPYRLAGGRAPHPGPAGAGTLGGPAP